MDYKERTRKAKWTRKDKEFKRNILESFTLQDLDELNKIPIATDWIIRLRIFLNENKDKLRIDNK